ncbi:16649_t:CDS:2, partial [Gigaspora rosea]
QQNKNLKGKETQQSIRGSNNDKALERDGVNMEGDYMSQSSESDLEEIIATERNLGADPDLQEIVDVCTNVEVIQKIESSNESEQRQEALTKGVPEQMDEDGFITVTHKKKKPKGRNRVVNLPGEKQAPCWVPPRAPERIINRLNKKITDMESRIAVEGGNSDLEIIVRIPDTPEITDPKEILNYVKEQYAELYTTEAVNWSTYGEITKDLPQVAEEDNINLLRRFEAEEISSYKILREDETVTVLGYNLNIESRLESG